MPNVLEGLQYRELKPNFTSWNTQHYKEWVDATNETSFASGTQFRVKPKFTYVVKYYAGTDGRTDTTTEDKTRAMGRVAVLTEQGYKVEIEKTASTSPSVNQWLTDNKIQYKAERESTWTAGVYFVSNVNGLSERTQFRVRPDNYFQVRVQNGIAVSDLTFDDVDELEKYVSRQLRTSENSITISKKAYSDVSNFLTINFK